MKRGEKYKFIIEKHLALTQFLLASHCHIFNIISWNVDVVACLLNVILRSKAIESNVNDKCKRVATIINLLNFLPHKRFAFYLNNFDAISHFLSLSFPFVLIIFFIFSCFRLFVSHFVYTLVVFALMVYDQNDCHVPMFYLT